MPLASRLVEGVIASWLDTATGLALAGYGTVDPAELAARAAIEILRHLHLDNYHYTVVPMILDELRRAGLLAGGEPK